MNFLFFLTIIQFPFEEHADLVWKCAIQIICEVEVCVYRTAVYSEVKEYYAMLEDITVHHYLIFTSPLEKNNLWTYIYTGNSASG